MTIFDELPPDKLTPARLWSALDVETRRLAASSVYAAGSDDPAARLEAEAAIATSLRFRPAAVSRLPVQKRIDYLTRAVRADDALAGTLLRVLHLTRRKELLGAFLDALGIPQRDGVIDTDEELDPPPPEVLGAALTAVRDRFPADQVELYVATLLALEPEFWGGLSGLVRAGD